jgi:hypothetical protein
MVIDVSKAISGALDQTPRAKRGETMASSSRGRTTYKRVGDDPQRVRIVEGSYGTHVGFIAEHTGKSGYLIVTPDGRGAVAYADKRVDAMREVCDELGISRRSVIGKKESE